MIEYLTKHLKAGRVAHACYLDTHKALAEGLCMLEVQGSQSECGSVSEQMPPTYMVQAIVQSKCQS